MTINEDTGEDVVCPVCKALEYWECGHLVAGFDRSFCECFGGEFFDQQHTFRGIIEKSFLSHHTAGSSPSFSSRDLKALWETARLNASDGEVEIALDSFVFQRVLIEALSEAGAIEPEGSLIMPGGPGMTSSVSLLFSESPQACIETAKASLQRNLGLH
jgi:hypothetical protein